MTGPCKGRESRVVPSRLSEVMRYLGAHSHEMPSRELECAVLYWERGLSLSMVAAEMGVSVACIRRWTRRTEERVWPITCVACNT